MDQSRSSPEGDNWRIDMMVRIHQADTNATRHGSNQSRKISTPPKALVDVKPQSYCPQILTIGPLYEMLGGSSSLYDCKALCVKRFMGRHGISSVHRIVECLFDDRRNLHRHYSGLPNYSDEALKLMVTVDTIFLNEFLLFLRNDWKSEEYDFFFNTVCNNGITIKQVWRDLFLMGNQIPMSFLMKLIETFPNKPSLRKDEICETLVHVFNFVDPFTVRHAWYENQKTPDFLHCNHLLDCLYVWVLRGRPQKIERQVPDRKMSCNCQLKWDILWPKESTNRSNLRERLPTASQLSKAGIWFRAVEGSISVMKYDKRSLRFDLPRIVVYDKTEDVLRNLLAHEQTSREEADFTKYAVIMDSLIDTAEDVAILTKARVIENHLGSDERLVKMWNNMCITVADGPCDPWDAMIGDVLHHYRSRWRSMYVEFCEKFFSRPWLTISLLAAFLLLLFTLMQTGYTVAGYYQLKP